MCWVDVMKTRVGSQDYSAVGMPPIASKRHFYLN